jgi:hypothetical protein
MALHQNGNVVIKHKLGVGSADAAGEPYCPLHVASGSPAQVLIQMDADTAGGEAQLLFKADSTGPGALYDDRIKAGIIFRRDDPGTRGTGNLHFCVEGNNSDVNVSTSHSRIMIDSNGNVGIGSTNPETKRLQVAHSSTDFTAHFINSHGSTPKGVQIEYTGSSPNSNSAYWFLYCEDTTEAKAKLRSNGYFYLAGTAYGSDR